MDPNSKEAKSLISWKVPKDGKVWKSQFPDTGKIIVRLHELLRSRISSQAPTLVLTIEELNSKLDELALASSLAEKEIIFRYFYSNCTLEEQIWVARIILKHMELGMTEHSILPLLHPDANKFYAVNCDLQSVCQELSDPTIHHTDFPLQVFKPFLPMQSKPLGNGNREYAFSDLEAIFKDGKGYWVETKLDGERMQMHYELGIGFKWYTYDIFISLGGQGTRLITQICMDPLLPKAL